MATETPAIESLIDACDDLLQRMRESLIRLAEAAELLRRAPTPEPTAQVYTETATPKAASRYSRHRRTPPWDRRSESSEGKREGSSGGAKVTKEEGAQTDAIEEAPPKRSTSSSEGSHEDDKKPLWKNANVPGAQPGEIYVPLQPLIADCTPISAIIERYPNAIFVRDEVSLEGNISYLVPPITFEYMSPCEVRCYRHYGVDGRLRYASLASHYYSNWGNTLETSVLVLRDATGMPASSNECYIRI